MATATVLIAGMILSGLITAAMQSYYTAKGQSTQAKTIKGERVAIEAGKSKDRRAVARERRNQQVYQRRTGQSMKNMLKTRKTKAAFEKQFQDAVTRMLGMVQGGQSGGVGMAPAPQGPAPVGLPNQQMPSNMLAKLSQMPQQTVQQLLASASKGPHSMGQMGRMAELLSTGSPGAGGTA